MTKYLIAIAILFSFKLINAQQLQLTNALVVGQMDRPEDKFTLEINLAELLANEGINVMPSLNALKQGASASVLVSDSVSKILSEKKIDTYLLVNVRGYDRKFRPTSKFEDLSKELESSHLFPLFRDEIVSITFEFTFFRGGKVITSELLKLGNISDRNAVIKKLRKKLPKMIKHWKK
jgi:hypothetical protein